MKNKPNRFISVVSILFASIFLSGLLHSQELEFTVLNSAGDWQAARDAAKKSGKNIFLDIYATWCGPCKMMDANVYTNASVAEYYNSNYINLKVDGETEFGLVLASKYKLTAYPSMFFLNPNEEKIIEIVGYRDPEALLNSGKTVAESGNRFMELNALYKKSGLSEKQNAEFMDLLLKFDRKDILAELAGNKIKSFTDSDILNPANKSILVMVPGDIESFPVKTIVQNADSIGISWGMQDLGQYLSQVFNLSMQKAIETRDEILMEKIANDFVPVFLKQNPDKIADAKLTTRKIYFSQLKDYEKYIQAVEKQFAEFGNKDPRFYYLESYYIVENQLFDPVLLNKAGEWLDKVIAVSPNFESFFLGSLINTYKQDFPTAKMWMQKAEGLAVTADQKKSLEELKNYLNGMAD